MSAAEVAGLHHELDESRQEAAALRQEIATLQRQNATLRQQNEEAAPGKLARENKRLKTALKKARRRDQKGNGAITPQHRRTLLAALHSARVTNPAQRKRLAEAIKIVNSLPVVSKSKAESVVRNNSRRQRNDAGG
jgi:dsDNA-specific endonuclease/ATPase MutS2